MNRRENEILSNAGILQGLRKQHKLEQRDGYDGHNRKPGIDMHQLHRRSQRHLWHLRMKVIAENWGY